jgi:hypothetical protein
VGKISIFALGFLAACFVFWVLRSRSDLVAQGEPASGQPACCVGSPPVVHPAPTPTPDEQATAKAVVEEAQSRRSLSEEDGGSEQGITQTDASSSAAEVTVTPPSNTFVTATPAANSYSERQETRSIEERAIALLDRAQIAMGGSELLAGIRDATILGDAILYPQGVHNRVLVKFIAPSYQRIESNMPSPGSILFTNGTSGWISTSLGVTALTDKQVRDLAFYDLARLLQCKRHPDLFITGVGPNCVIIGSNTGQAARIEFAEESGLPLRLIRNGSASGTESESRLLIDTFEEWRAVEGVNIPFRTVTTVDGRKGREQTLLSVQFNSGLSLNDLYKR